MNSMFGFEYKIIVTLKMKRGFGVSILLVFCEHDYFSMCDME